MSSPHGRASSYSVSPASAPWSASGFGCCSGAGSRKRKSCASPASNQPTSSCSPERQLGPRARGDAQGRDTRGVLSDNGGAYLSTTKFTSRSAPDQEEGSESTWLGGEQPRRHQRRRSPPASG